MNVKKKCEMNVDGKIVIYADDTCLLVSGSNWENLRQNKYCY